MLSLSAFDTKAVWFYDAAHDNKAAKLRTGIAAAVQRGLSPAGDFCGYGHCAYGTADLFGCCFRQLVVQSRQH